ncbi:MAG: hypothetical protein KF833_02245 [Verrucomicrobiae bacterium]|nr:hypothetical protein [Verrucomicrobiae bacterium]
MHRRTNFPDRLRRMGRVLALALGLATAPAATAATISLTGRVPGVAGLTMNVNRPPGTGILGSGVTDIEGRYTITFQEPGTGPISYTVQPANGSGLSYSPASQPVTVLVNSSFGVFFGTVPDLSGTLNLSGQIPANGAPVSVALEVPVTPIGVAQLANPAAATVLTVRTNVDLAMVTQFTTTAGAFYPGGPTDRFGLVGETTFVATNGGGYQFSISTDDGGRMAIETLGGTSLLEIGTDGVHAMSPSSGSVSLNAGQTYRVRMRYFEATGDAGILIAWVPPGGSFQPFQPPQGWTVTYYDLSRLRGTTTANASGNYSFSRTFSEQTGGVTLPLSGVTLRPTYPGFSFNPAVRSANGSGTTYHFAVASSPPTIQSVPNQTTPEEVPKTVFFTVSDLQTPAGSLVVTATSSNPSIVAAGDMQLGGSGANRSITLSPRPNATGTTSITLTVRDGESLTASTSFNLTVNNVNDAPIAGSRYGLVFDGVNDEVVAPALVITNRSFTIEAWVKRAGTDRWDIVAWQGQGALNQGMHFGFRDNNRFTFAFWGNDLDQPVPFTGTGWHHWAGTYDIETGLRRLYLDGQLVAQDATTNAFVGVSPFRLGRRPAGGHYFEGGLDEVRVWSVARSQTEIATKRFEPLVGNESGLLAYWRLDEAGTIFAADSSGNGRHGALTYPGGPEWGEPADGFGNWLVPEDSPGTPVYLPGYDVDSPGITYEILSVSEGLFNRTSGSVSNLTHNPVFYTPPENFNGMVTVQYRVSDGPLQDTHTFQIEVLDLNDPPFISVIPDQVVLEDMVLGPIPFTVSDPDDPAENLLVSASSGDLALVPAGGLVLEGSGENRSVTVIPAAGESGTVEITLTAYDGYLSFERRFQVRVEPRPAYKIFDLGALPNRPVAFGAALNDNGAVLADAAQNAQGQSRRAFVFSGLESGSGLIEVGTLAGTTSSGSALNDLNEVVGTSPDGAGRPRAFLRSAAGGFELRDLGTLVGGDRSYGTALNGEGAAVGYGNVTGGKDRGFLFVDGPSLVELGPLPTHGDASRAWGINDSNLVAGVSYDASGRGQATLWGAATNGLGFLPGGDDSVAYAINRFGWVVGSGNTIEGGQAVRRGFLWNGESLMSLGTLPGGRDSEARSINRFGQVVGSAVVSNQSRAILVSAGQIYDLNEVVPEEDRLAWRLTEASGINSRGEIVGSGTLNGVPRAFLAVPANLIGRKVTRPAGSVAGVPPQIELLQSQVGDTPQNAFHFSPATGWLYAIRPVTARVKWPTSTNPLDTNAPPIPVLNVNVWPRQPQVHIAGAPVETEPAITGFEYALQTLLHTTSAGANVDGSTKVFTAGEPGYSVLYYLQNFGQPSDSVLQAPYFEVVRTFRWNDPRVLTPAVDNVTLPIGQPVTSAFHRDHPGRNGWMHFERSPYDGTGPERAYDRATRTGVLLPVNRDTASALDDFVVIWYATNTIRVAWAHQPVRYNPVWPIDAPRIVIASTEGSGPLDFAIYGATLRVYNQPDAGLPGFNPNEEHALIAPANGGGGAALFALRNDLNRFHHHSEPYALLKYREPASGQWRIQPFEVVAEDAFHRFEYAGVAGNEIAPPYPLPLLNLCEPSHGVSGPYWEDYNGRLYARAAGHDENLTADVVARWWYPRQPAFFYDLDGDGESDVQAGSCLGLLEHRQSGNPSQLPVDVRYTIRWPDAPVLQIGESVLRAKRGLPDLLRFASAEIIWDSSNPTIDLTGANLLESAVRLFDPLGDRILKVPELEGLAVPGDQFQVPAAIKTSIRAGKVRFDDLPPDIAERLAYDPLNKWFIFSGVFDETRTAGEPFYLLNILTERERERIKDLDGATGSSTDWDKAIDALYDLTRNPNQVDLDPRDGQPDRALRVGLITNAAGDVVLEALPETKALSAAIGNAPPPEPRPGRALSLNGSGAHVNAGASIELAGLSFAIEFWARRATAGAEHLVIGQGTGTPFGGIEAGFRADNRFVFSFRETGADVPLVTAETTAADAWHHWAVTYDALTGQRVIYRDGVALASDTAAAGYTGSGTFFIGRGVTGGFFAGELDDVRIWNQPRTGFTVAKDRSKRLLGTEEGLLRYFRFDEASGAALDSGTVGLSGTLAGGATRVDSTAPTGIPPRFVTVAENSDGELKLPVSLHVIRIDDGPFTGQLNDIAPANVFSEMISVRHSADFGAEPERLTFEWWYRPDGIGVDPTDLPVVDPVTGDVTDPRGWLLFTAYTPPDGRGVNYVTLGDGGMSSLLTLGDNWLVMRYRGFNVNGAMPWSEWAGDPSGGPTARAKLVEGWIKRVIRGLNPFDQRISDFHANDVNTFASMLVQAGRRYEGDIAFNPEGDAINSIGLIEAYETVLRRGRRLSIDGTPAVNYDAANNALLLVASRIADLYVLLGNEAYADASDPTIGFATVDGEYGTAATSIFAFQNQLDSLLEEELALLRGRDDRGAGVGASPVYNRLFWNFTLGDGEVAYQQAYNVHDFNEDGFIDERDARIMYPQGHGDAWGHYLTAIKTWYELLRHENFTWVPRAENVLVNGVAVQVDFLDERKFARTAAARARAGAEIVNLTYRLNYVDDPEGQWQGYEDTDPGRAWGVTDWARRTGQAAVFDWMVANAILPAVDPDPANTGITRIDRTTVRELGEIESNLREIQMRMDEADVGLNPLGVAKGAVPFDIEPQPITEPGSYRETHFEQIQERAMKALGNAVKIWDEANKFTSLLRRNQDSAEKFIPEVRARERVYRNELIEIFGYPYAGDIGPGRTYPSGYQGPDLYHYMYVNTTEITGENAPPSPEFTAFFKPLEDGHDGHVFFPGSDRRYDVDTVETSVLEVRYPQVAGAYTFAAPASWGQRRAPGELQEALAAIVQEQARFKVALQDYDGVIRDIEDAVDLLEAQKDVNRHQIEVLGSKLAVITTMNLAIATLQATQIGLKRAAEEVDKGFTGAIQGLPTVAGLATDPSFSARLQIVAVSSAMQTGFNIGADVAEVAQNFVEAGKETVEMATELSVFIETSDFEVTQRVRAIEALFRQEAGKRIEVFAQRENLIQAMGRYRSTLAKGERLLEELVRFRKQASAETTEQRYQDMTFRIFRNDALNKYRAAFDLAARYVYLAATAYDYELNLLGTDSRSGRDFLTDIIRQRGLGQVLDGTPMVGVPGLADPMGRMAANFSVLRSQFGLNNPQLQAARFSLREEFFRIGGSADADALWREQLQRARVADLWALPEFRRYCRPFAPETGGPQPGLAIRFPTTITFGLNLFGWPLGPGDSAYDPSLYATKIGAVGVAFEGEDATRVSQTPRVYLVPVGLDVMRSPTGSDLATREWRVLDQVVPVPFPIGASSLSDPNWHPKLDALSGSFAQVRRYASFRAFHDSGLYSDAEITRDSRLVGRSVWNTEWVLIIPGGTLLADPNLGIETFIDTVNDIKLSFETYSYSGN